MNRRLALTTLVLSLACLPAVVQAEPPIARLAAYSGDVSVVRDGHPLSLFQDLPLDSGDTVATRDGRAAVRFLDETEVRVHPQSRISVTEGATWRSIDLVFGRLWASIVGLRERETRFTSGQTVAAVRGTRIELFRDAVTGQVRAGVIEGVLEFTSGGVTVRLEAGQMASAMPGEAPSAPEPYAEGSLGAEVVEQSQLKVPDTGVAGGLSFTQVLSPVLSALSIAGVIVNANQLQDLQDDLAALAEQNDDLQQQIQELLDLIEKGPSLSPTRP